MITIKNGSSAFATDLLAQYVPNARIPREGAKRVLSFLLAVAVFIASYAVNILALAVTVLNNGLDNTSVIGYTDGEPIIATRRDYSFDNSSLLIGGYGSRASVSGDDGSQTVAWAKEAGLDFLISNHLREDFLTVCDELGLGMILLDHNIPGRTATLPRIASRLPTADDYQKWLNITEEQYNADSFYSHECVWGVNIIDEPPRQCFEVIAEVVEHFRDNVPGKIALVNQFPFCGADQLGLSASLETARGLPLLDRIDSVNGDVARYKAFISDYINTTDTDYICFDIYPLKIEKVGDEYKKGTGQYWLRNLDILSEACRKTNRDLWVITQSSGTADESGGSTDTGPRYTDTPEDIRWQYYVTLSFGAKAIINALYYCGWWDTDSHMIDANRQRTDTYYAVQTVTGEISAFKDLYGDYKHLGAFLVNGRKAAGNKTNTLCPVEDEALKPEVKTKAPILVGCFNAESGGGRAYTLVNMWEPETEKTASASVTFEGASKITVYQKGVVSTVQGDTLELELESCEGVFVTVES